MKPSSPAFVNPIVVGFLVAIAVSVSAGLGLVWMRHRNSTLAKSNSELTARIAAVERRSDEMATFVQTELRPERLRKLNDDLSLGLVPMNEVPFKTVTENVAAGMADRANRTFLPLPDAPAGAPPSVKFVRR
ncbi:MAG: hypothetical protein JNL39_14875 [Opitutaceae bacterium]|nr:hypothetical protein [Opitutaceae bacterium]